MPGLKEVRIRLASVKSTQQITSAMKMVSASKLKRAHNAIFKIRPYSGKLKEILENLNAEQFGDDNIFSKEQKSNKILVVPVTSNRGLCGAFNANVIKAVVALICNKFEKQYKCGNLDIYCIGKKSSDFFTKRKFNVIENNSRIFDKLSFENASVISEFLMNSFIQGKYSKIIIVYNQFKNAAVQILTTEQFLPSVKNKSSENKTKQLSDYLFEPGKKQIINELIPKSLKIQLYKILLDSFAAEHGARMTAMHKATDNADTLLKDLKLSYNKARQAAITKEILEIVGGAEALKG